MMRLFDATAVLLVYPSETVQFSVKIRFSFRGAHREVEMVLPGDKDVEYLKLLATKELRQVLNEQNIRISTLKYMESVLDGSGVISIVFALDCCNVVDVQIA
eukprot:m.132947 g.132947  ORF g.132947 m.132947 type:complete len:102 (-) comp17515_c0_seq5:109-414(-)